MRFARAGQTLDDQLVQTWWRINRFLASEFEGANAIESLTIGQLNLLRGMRERPLTMTEVAGVAGATRGAATGLVDRLVARGLAERHQDAKNRRTILVKLTPKGRKLEAEVHRRAIARSRQLTQYLDPEDATALNNLLLTLRQTVETKMR